jgi:YVTN family beta-propeller protein
MPTPGQPRRPDAARRRRAAARRRQIRRRRVAALTALAALVATVTFAAVGGFPGGRHGVRRSTPEAHRSRSQPHARSPRAVNVYAHTFAGMFTPVSRRARYLVYAPDSRGDGVYVIDPKTRRMIRYIPTGAQVQHVVPAWNLRTLYATNDLGNTLTPINPNTGRRAGPNIPVADPYNLYFTPDGRHAIVVEEGRNKLAFRDPHTFAVQKLLRVHCAGVDHMDFSANGSFALASCEFSAQMVRIDLRTETASRYVRVGGSPQDVKLSPDGRTFYVANRSRGGVQLIDARTLRLVGFIRTARDAHGLYVSRNTRDLYVTNRSSGSISVINLATRRLLKTWHVGGTPDMGGLSPDGTVFWAGGRYTATVYAFSTRTWRRIASIPAGISPHGVCVWPQPGRYSTGHTGVTR